jgi:hypothetical protein
MKRRVIWLVVALALVVGVLPGMAWASPSNLDAGWFAEYYANHDLAGAPTLTRYEPQIDYDWGMGSPTAMLPADNFSARWTRTMYFEAGTYNFCATVDDGVRFWVDGQLLIDEWRVQGLGTYCASPYLTAGNHVVQMAFFEDTGNAVARLTWSGPLPNTPAPYPQPWPPSPSEAWTGEYYDDMMLGESTSPAKAPVMIRMDPDINFNWGTNSPAVGLPRTEYSIRWTRDINFNAGLYNFCVTVDDGARLWVDGSLVIDEWREQSVRTFCGEHYMTAGLHTVQLGYVQMQGSALVALTWTSGSGPVPTPYPPYPYPTVVPPYYPTPVPPYYPTPVPPYYPTPVPPYYPTPVPPYYPTPVPPPGYGWTGEYFSNRYLSGAPVLTRQDAEINFDWGLGSPAPSIPPDNFSVRWTQEVYFNNGTYTFFSHNDDGVRIYVDGSLVVDAWYEQSAATHYGVKALNAGTHRVQVDYYEATQFAVIAVWWQEGGVVPYPTVVPPYYPTPVPPYPYPTPVPPYPYPTPEPPYPYPTPEPPYPPPGPVTEVIVDNTDPGFIWGGPVSSRYFAYLGFGGNMFWTYNSYTDPINYGKWKPRLTGPGYYEVYAFIPRNYATSTNVRYRIIHSNGQRHDRIVNQYAYCDQWVSLGTYYFNASQNEFVLVYDNTREPFGTQMVAFDAIKFVPRY